jgi:hypothetical protein
VASARFATPGPFTLAVPGGCAGGMREVVARLFEDGGDTMAERRQPLPFGFAPVVLGELAPSELKAVCGAGASGRLSLQPVAGACSSFDARWQQLGGTALEQRAGQGEIDVQSVARDLSPAGETLTFEWALDGGPGNVASGTRTVSVGVDPFVVVSTRTTPLIRQEESAFDVTVILRNTTSCAVDGLEVRVPLSAATPLAATLRVDGAPHEAIVDGEVLVATGISLPADGQVVLTLGARPRLLGSPSAAPEVSLRGLPVSTLAPATSAASGCGCSSGHATLVLCIAILALVRRRRSAQPAARSKR